ncbi:rubisco accumulation factor 1 [Chloropicon primus]|uniref:Uncharacterized protein n=2 Tax=Chloropicon primus TaxID=1764295 RepID=A0A5B8MN98_9CHLO|nr:hypothetical protein A3770_06p42790 [Chloropicon primus]UPR00983.1 rubisco accumulation factor 1 [Chloropicon primus]|eukprot:QDZ21761.1 hypothetical protein A3770_06p42790 [Chloropicon primus]
MRRVGSFGGRRNLGRVRATTRMGAGFPGMDGGGDRRKLIIPSQGVGMDRPSKGAGPGIVGFVQEGEGAESRNKFQLPKNFMDRAPGQEQEQEGDDLTIDDMLTILTERTDVWHSLAIYVTRLKTEGIGSEIIDDVAGINALEQNLWVVGSNVYKTLEDRKVSEDLLSYYSQFGAEKLLYPLRVMTAEDRQTCAEYISAEGLDEKQCETLVRAMREHARRTYDSDRLMFDYNPGDCLAYKYYRDALEETRNPERKRQIVEQGLQRATSERGREALEELLVEKEDDESKGRIPVVELDDEEFDTCLLSIAGELQGIGVADLKAASATNRKGPFGIVTVGKSDEEWISLPMFQPFVAGFDMIAITVDNMMDLESYGAKTGGPGVLVVDRRVDRANIDTEGLYAITFDDNEISFVSGTELLSQVDIVGEDKLKVLAKALMAVKPPGKQSEWGDATAVINQSPEL